LATEAELASRREWYLSLIDLLKVRARTIDDIVRQAEPYFGDEVSYDPDAVAKQWKDRGATAELLTAVRDRLAISPPSTADELLLVWRDGDRGGTLAQGAELAARARATSRGRAPRSA
jgi:glutamyl-tRNA synthetase